MLTLESQVVDLEALVVALGVRDDRSVADQGVVDARVGLVTLLVALSLGIYTQPDAPHTTRLVWNSFKSTLIAPSKRRLEVIELTTCAISRLRCW